MRFLWGGRRQQRNMAVACGPAPQRTCTHVRTLWQPRPPEPSAFVQSRIAQSCPILPLLGILAWRPIEKIDIDDGSNRMNATRETVAGEGGPLGRRRVVVYVCDGGGLVLFVQKPTAKTPVKLLNCLLPKLSFASISTLHLICLHNNYFTRPADRLLIVSFHGGLVPKPTQDLHPTRSIKHRQPSPVPHQAAGAEAAPRDAR